MNKRFLLICSRPPYGSSAARDLLDIALTCSVFEQSVSLLLMGDAILQLLPEQNPTAIRQKNLNAIQSSLALYDIESIYVDAEALRFHGLSAETLLLKPQALEPDALQQLIREQDVVLPL
ncbi:tRNA 5-methylaminomethyl-2-thiouridine synthase TusC [Nitrincola lacisaponensis]|uniref:tRNA 5-methylaminomethyl-2-thiouridine synthase TusC n=1 Tax=Nitrincola lacisaponensis TaxID=267850 RepID=A0A063Y5L1_9GAMM|nr:sulfurtransferase complex subunit TusC [Nitrincola lacisaponensis]KDE40041.1 tRNA 5-methylaminomethyl-2-thiouridine synthase TusC [Nitrincola lacisaponensis]